MVPKVGMTAHFYRDRDFPGSRGPYAAKITGIVRLNETVDSEDGGCCTPSTVNLSVLGELGGSWTEHSIPFLTGNYEDPGTRYCTPIKEDQGTG